ncbi:MAG: hypothetical protein KF833_02335 [Verrucomicrobiae bacterium]|nr:hypothetical protein [Verrucomicrobiae bacterium]
MRYVELLSRELPPEAVTALEELLGKTPGNARSNATIKDGDREVKLVDYAKAELSRFAQVLKSAADEVFRLRELSDLEVERALLRAVRRDLGYRALSALTDDARKKLTGNVVPTERFDECLKVVQHAEELGRPDIAELWIRRAELIRDENPNAISETQRERLESLTGKIRMSSLGGVLAVI